MGLNLFCNFPHNKKFNRLSRLGRLVPNYTNNSMTNNNTTSNATTNSFTTNSTNSTDTRTGTLKIKFYHGTGCSTGGGDVAVGFLGRCRMNDHYFWAIFFHWNNTSKYGNCTIFTPIFSKRSFQQLKLFHFQILHLLINFTKTKKLNSVMHQAYVKTICKKIDLHSNST